MRLLLAALAVVTALVAYSVPATAQPIKQVEVVNFPDPQNVTGAVAVTNIPDPQNVTGFVEVTNFPAPATPSRFQLVGFSSTPVTGGTGVLGMTSECQNDFPARRMCTSIEVMETVNAPASLSGAAWVRPVFQQVATNVVVDASGVAAGPESLTCFGWIQSFSSRLGLTVNATGGFVQMSCNVTRPVACCALVP